MLFYVIESGLLVAGCVIVCVSSAIPASVAALCCVGLALVLQSCRPLDCP